MSFIVGIDGPAGSGKGTVTKAISNKLGLINIDTGATYRCVALKALKNAKSFIRKALASRVDIRHIPELEFVYDESLEYGKRIEDKIKEIHE